MTLRTEPYIEQLKRWPTAGRHILAQASDDAVVVYQAYRPSIGRFAVENQRFGDDFSFRRMSWIKPNFLWMMYRSGWGTKEGQEVVLAIWLRRPAFEKILTDAVPSAFPASNFSSREDWAVAVAGSDIRLQWDPDHDPTGAHVERRAIQLGLRGGALRAFAHEWILQIEDISGFVAQQRANVSDLRRLITPSESVYTPSVDAARNVGIDPMRV